MSFFRENGETSRTKQTEIPAHENRHDYSQGLDKALQKQQLADIVKVQPVRLGAARSKNKGTTGTPLFDPQPEQTKLF